jgi:hypothetical protein
MNADQQQQQQQRHEGAEQGMDAADAGSSGSGSGSSSGARLHWMRQGLRTGLQQLQQGVSGLVLAGSPRALWCVFAWCTRPAWCTLCTSPQTQATRVLETPGVQKALNGVDQQLTWLQQRPQSKALWSLGSKLTRGMAGGAWAGSGGSAGNGADCCALAAASLAASGDAAVSLGRLREQLTSLQLMEAAAEDPCRRAVLLCRVVHRATAGGRQAEALSTVAHRRHMTHRLVTERCRCCPPPAPSPHTGTCPRQPGPRLLRSCCSLRGPPAAGSGRCLWQQRAAS